jgi:hypothetical protein
MPRTKLERKATMLRLPESLYAALAAEAERDERSWNAEAVVALREWLAARKAAAGRKEVR